jgi:maltooligosyltrehalose synthase
VRSYVVDAAFGGPDALAAARTALRDRGASLLLDYVPNHVAPDHPWVRDIPELFVLGGEDDISIGSRQLDSRGKQHTGSRSRSILPAVAGRCAT